MLSNVVCNKIIIMVVIEHAMNLVEVNVSDVDRIRPSHIIGVASQVSRWNEM